MQDARSAVRRRLGAIGARLTVRLVPLLVLAAPAIAWAQDNAPPDPSLKRFPARIVGYLVIAVLLAIVVAVSLMPSKRGHQD